MIIFFFTSNKKMTCVEGRVQKIPKFKSARDLRQSSHRYENFFFNHSCEECGVDLF
jgi:hypothetical protein